MEPSDEGTREPPADAGSGKVRLLDRELWGQREIMVRTAPSFVPDKSLYTNTPYQPPEPDSLTEREGESVARFIAAAKQRGMKVWFQVQSAIPPGYRVQFGGPRDQDRPLGPDGEAGPKRVDSNAGLGAPDVLEYGRAMMKDLAHAYPDLDGIRLDWPEYPPYHAHALFFDFSEPALDIARSMGIDVDRMRLHSKKLRRLLSDDLTDSLLANAAPLNDQNLTSALRDLPGVLDLLKLRRKLSGDLLTSFREALPQEMALVPQTFPPPFNLLSGFDFGASASRVQGIGVKFYTMHWPMILFDYAKAMSSGSASGAAISQALVSALGTAEQAPETPEHFHYPEPDEAHTASNTAIREKLATAKAAAGDCPIYAFTHAYGPLADVIRRAEACWDASQGNMWVNRYGYMSNDKIEAFGKLVKP
jgi:hypothetical protein